MAPTPENSRQKANCTAVVGRVHADALAVCRAGPMVALHLHTSAGEVIVTLSEKDFVLAARTRADSNGNPWRELPDATARAAILEADAAAVSLARNGRMPCDFETRNQSELTAAKHAKFLKIEEAAAADPSASFASLCREFGVNSSNFYVWRRNTGRATHYVTRRRQEAVA